MSIGRLVSFWNWRVMLRPAQGATVRIARTSPDPSALYPSASSLHAQENSRTVKVSRRCRLEIGDTAGLETCATNQRALALIFAIFIVGATGCSHFNRDWRRAGVALPAAGSVEGRWEGMWESDVNHHHGKLRCLLTQETNSTYKAQFRATFGGILKYHYTAHLEMQPHATLGWEFNGEANLGRLAGGRYYYEGRATPTNMISIYRCKYDHGTFDLHRP